MPHGYLRRVMTRFTVIGKWLSLVFPEDLPVTAAGRVFPSTEAVFGSRMETDLKYLEFDTPPCLIFGFWLNCCLTQTAAL